MKIIRESISFERGKGTKRSIGIGLREKIFNFLDPLTYDGSGKPYYNKSLWHYEINDDLTITTFGFLDFRHNEFVYKHGRLPDYIKFKEHRKAPGSSFEKFGKIAPTNSYVSFAQSWLNSLEGMPIRIEGSFAINHNDLKSLKGPTEEVVGDFYVYGNPLESLEGCPKFVKSLYIYNTARFFSEEEIRSHMKVLSIYRK